MESYSARGHQELIKEKLASRDNGHVQLQPRSSETIPKKFDAVVERHPHAPAIVSNGITLSYEELARKSYDIGARMVAVGNAQVPFAVLLSEYTQFIPTALGILRSGGFYVALDPSFPEDRNARILKQSNARCVVTARVHQQLAERIALPGQTLIYADEVERDIRPLADRSSPAGLGCIIFTSGSTGYPKGVLQTQQNMVGAARRFANTLYIGSADRVSLLSSSSVTASIGTVFGSLLSGATLCPFSVRTDGLNKLADWLDAERINVYRSVPSLFRSLLQSIPEQRVFPNVQIVRVGGDSLYKSDWDLFVQHFREGSVLVNAYGCSEISTVIRFYMDTASRLSDGVLPVGYPTDDVDVSIVGPDGSTTSLSGDGDVAPSLGAGEIVLTSDDLAPGYWNDAAASDAAFMAAERPGSTRAYKTGDLGVIWKNQGLVHVGRGDQQVKVSGYRIEIAEVEACLRSYPAVKEAAVIVHNRSDNERELVGFVVFNPGVSKRGSDVRLHVQSRLPAHMVPSEIVAVAQIPYTPNGKIDRHALTELREEAWRCKTSQRPRTSTERVLCDIWSQLLKVEDVGVEDNFFELGGNSLTGMKLAAKIVESLAVPIQTLAVFQHPTVSLLAELIDRLSAERSHDQAADTDETQIGTV